MSILLNKKDSIIHDIPLHMIIKWLLINNNVYNFCLYQYLHLLYLIDNNLCYWYSNLKID